MSAFVAVTLAVWVAVATVQFAFIALVVARLRRRFPTLEQQRAYLLRRMANYNLPHLGEEERLKWLWATGQGMAGSSFGLAVTLISSSTRLYLGLQLGDNSLEWNLFGLLVAAAIIAWLGVRPPAIGWLSRCVLRQS
jgi:hypothetical protein